MFAQNREPLINAVVAETGGLRGALAGAGQWRASALLTPRYVGTTRSSRVG